MVSNFLVVLLSLVIRHMPLVEAVVPLHTAKEEATFQVAHTAAVASNTAAMASNTAAMALHTAVDYLVTSFEAAFVAASSTVMRKD